MQAKIIASFTYPHYANRGKVGKILEVLREYRKTAELIAKDQWKIFFMTGRFSKHAKLRHIQSNLSERYKQVCLWQVVSILESYTSSIASKIREIILSSTITKEGKVSVRLVKELKSKRDSYIPAVESMAINLGLRPLIATDRGDLLGRQFSDFLSEYDRRISTRLSSLQKRGIRPSTDRKYRELVRKLREFLKKEINRLIQSFGKRFVREKLRRLEELYGIQVVEVNPAYSSQECSSCGYVDKKNRKDTQGFECGLCGRKIKAQVNSARNILKRASLLGIFKPATAKKRGCDSAALEVLKNNPYYRDFLNPCSGGSRFL